MEVIWTPEAEDDRAAIWNYIFKENPAAAKRMDALFSNAADRLAIAPRMGRIGKIPGTREVIPHENYRLVYEIDGDTIWIMTLMHTSRQWPPLQANEKAGQ